MVAVVALEIAVRPSGASLAFGVFDLTAEAAGRRVVLGNALEESTLRRCNLETRRGFVALTENEGINFIVARNVRELFQVRNVLAAFDRRPVGLQSTIAQEHGLHVLFGLARDLEFWGTLARQAELSNERFVLEHPGQGADVRGVDGGADEMKAMLLPVLYRRGSRVIMMDERWVPRKADTVTFLVATARAERARVLLTRGGWRRLPGRERAARPPARDPQPAVG